jgi:hypothetical protein
MTHAVCGRRELQRHFTDLQVLRDLQLRAHLTNAAAVSETGQNVIDRFLSAKARQKVRQENPLIVVRHAALQALEVGVSLVIRNKVVKGAKGAVQLADDDVLVVPLVPDQGRIVRPRMILQPGRKAVQRKTPPDLQAPAIGLVEIRLVRRAASVEVVEIEAGAAEIDIRCAVVGRQSLRRIECEVVVDELAQICVPGRHPEILFVILLVLGGGADDQVSGGVALRFTLLVLHRLRLGRHAVEFLPVARGQAAKILRIECTGLQIRKQTAEPGQVSGHGASPCEACRDDARPGESGGGAAERQDAAAAD